MQDSQIEDKKLYQDSELISTNPTNSQKPKKFKFILYILIILIFLSVFYFILNTYTYSGNMTNNPKIQVNTRVSSTSIPITSAITTSISLVNFKEINISSPSKAKQLLYKSGQWVLIYQGKEYNLPLPTKAPNSTVEYFSSEVNNYFFWSSNEEYIFERINGVTSMVVSLPPKEIKVVWSKDNKEYVIGGQRNYVFGGIFSSSNKFYVIYTGETDQPIEDGRGQKIKDVDFISVIDLNLSEPKEKIITKLVPFLSVRIPIGISPKESYLLFQERYEHVFEPTYLLNIQTGEVKDVNVATSIYNPKFDWDQNEKWINIDYINRIMENRITELDKVYLNTRYDIDTNKIRYNESNSMSYDEYNQKILLQQ